MQPTSHPSHSDELPVPTRPFAMYATCLITGMGVYAIDQLSKIAAVSYLDPTDNIRLLGDAFRLQLTRNSGAALSIGTGKTWVLTLISIVVVAAILRAIFQVRNRMWALTLGLLLGGAAGNLTDRLVREPGFGQGRVIDFLAYGTWFIGNIADIAIVLAAGLMLGLSARGVSMRGSHGA